MLFTSPVFLYAFLPLFLALYAATPRGWRSLTIAVASYVFYGWWRPDFVLLMLVSTAVDYACGRGIQRDREQGRPRRRRWLVLSLVVNLGLLAWFKYANFGIDTLNQVRAALGEPPIPWVDVVLPVGISFYTFQTLSYTVDVWRGVSPPVRNLRDFMCYVSMYPQLVAGPIVRYNTVAEQLHSRSHTLAKFGRGVLAFQIGLVKKVLVADVLGPLADAAFAVDDPTCLDAWIGILAYAFQIYFDFSGYSDMAIGLGLMIGFRLPINFDSPYRSISITDFWRRWHISLSSFLRDYLYIPLGGNRGSGRATYRNLMITMVLGGLWHGAAWTFVVWGGIHGGFLSLEHWRRQRRAARGLPEPPDNALRRTGQRLVTFHIVCLAWVFFRAESIETAFDLLGRLVWHWSDPSPLVTTSVLVAIAFGIGAQYIPKGAMSRAMATFSHLSPVTQGLALGFALLVTNTLGPRGVAPFIYFQF